MPPEGEVAEPKAEVDELKVEVAELKAEVDALQTEVHELTGEVRRGECERGDDNKKLKETFNELYDDLEQVGGGLRGAAFDGPQAEGGASPEGDGLRSSPVSGGAHSQLRELKQRPHCERLSDA